MLASVMTMMGFSPDQEALRSGLDELDAAGSFEAHPGLPAPGLMAAPSVMKPGVPVRRRPDGPTPPDGPNGSGGPGSTAVGSTVAGRSVAAELRRQRAVGSAPDPAADPGDARVDAGTAALRRGAPNAGDGDRTGLPGPLRASLEQLSGYDLSDVRVHYDSPEPARHHALAFTKGSDIEVGPGQEEHLAHEGWHVVQQKQGRVKSSRQMKGAALNADPLLEREADRMGARAAALHHGAHHDGTPEQSGPSRTRASIPAPALQLKGEKEFMKDPGAFMESNQVLVAFDEGVQQTYSLPPGMVEKIKTRQDALAADALQKVKERREQDVRNGKNLGEDAYGLSIAMAKDMNTPEAIKRKGDNFLTQLMSEAMSAVKCTMFTFATRTVQKGMFGFGGSTQYIVTPLLESMERSIPEDTMTTAPDGTEVSLQAALQGLKRIQPVEGVVQAAYIPYESNPNKVTGGDQRRRADRRPDHGGLHGGDERLLVGDQEEVRHRDDGVALPQPGQRARGVGGLQGGARHRRDLRLERVQRPVRPGAVQADEEPRDDDGDDPRRRGLEDQVPAERRPRGRKAADGSAEAGQGLREAAGDRGGGHRGGRRRGGGGSPQLRRPADPAGGKRLRADMPTVEACPPTAGR
jgi:hypothetical protein